MNKAHILARPASITRALRALLLGVTMLVPVALSAAEPSHIGPKGGDVRKGVPLTATTISHGAALAECPPRLGRPKGCASGGSAFPTTGIPAKWQAYVGPKGGVARKGLY